MKTLQKMAYYLHNKENMIMMAMGTSTRRDRRGQSHYYRSSSKLKSVKVAENDLWVWKVETTSAASSSAAEEKVKPQVVDGWIHTVDLQAGSFVLGGKNESQTTIRVGVKTGEREADIFLDGKKTNPATAIKPGLKASVTCVKVGDDLWASRMEITSAAK